MCANQSLTCFTIALKEAFITDLIFIHSETWAGRKGLEAPQAILYSFGSFPTSFTSITCLANLLPVLKLFGESFFFF